MIFEGDHSVIKAIKEKKRLIDEGKEHMHLRPALFVSGGAVKGSYALGALQAFSECGYKDVFSSAVGTSSGAMSLAYFLTDQIETALKLLGDESILRRFIAPYNIFNVLKIPYFIKLLEGVHSEPLKYNRLAERKTDFYIGVSEYDTAQPKLFSARSSDLIIKALSATVSVPGLTTYSTMIEGKRYVDGESTDPYIFSLATEVLKPTHVLVLTNQNLSVKNKSHLETMALHTIFRYGVSKNLRKAALHRIRTRRKWYETMKNSSIPFFSVWGDGSLGSFERNSKKIKKVVEKSRSWWHDLLVHKK